MLRRITLLALLVNLFLIGQANGWISKIDFVFSTKLPDGPEGRWAHV